MASFALSHLLETQTNPSHSTQSSVVSSHPPAFTSQGNPSLHSPRFAQTAAGGWFLPPPAMTYLGSGDPSQVSFGGHTQTHSLGPSTNPFTEAGTNVNDTAYSYGRGLAHSVFPSGQGHIVTRGHPSAALPYHGSSRSQAYTVTGPVYSQHAPSVTPANCEYRAPLAANANGPFAGLVHDFQHGDQAYATTGDTDLSASNSESTGLSPLTPDSPSAHEPAYEVNGKMAAMSLGGGDRSALSVAASQGAHANLRVVPPRADDLSVVEFDAVSDLGWESDTSQPANGQVLGHSDNPAGNFTLIHGVEYISPADLQNGRDGNIHAAGSDLSEIDPAIVRHGRAIERTGQPSPAGSSVWGLPPLEPGRVKFAQESTRDDNAGLATTAASAESEADLRTLLNEQASLIRGLQESTDTARSRCDSLKNELSAEREAFRNLQKQYTRSRREVSSLIVQRNVLSRYLSENDAQLAVADARIRGQEYYIKDLEIMRFDSVAADKRSDIDKFSTRTDRRFGIKSQRETGGRRSGVKDYPSQYASGTAVGHEFSAMADPSPQGRDTAGEDGDGSGRDIGYRIVGNISQVTVSAPGGVDI
ncbi:hypothetical protein I317_02502 [Kwoniella heveanensis CBS 569]|nr:hypothetical protein I317_02502 [Kwoniella heveanensis CBS 569]